MDALRSILQNQASTTAQMFAFAKNPPPVLIIEGGSTFERFLHAFAYSLLLSCNQQKKPCYSCDACSSLHPYSHVQQEYSSLDKKSKQDNGNYISLADCIYCNGLEGIYTKQIIAIKKHITDLPRFYKHIVIIENFHAIHSIKEIANAILKVMEESNNALFILLVPERNALLQTILSRAVVLTLPFITSSTLSIESPWIDALILFLSSGTGWFTRTASKIECSELDVRNMIMVCNIALCEYMRQENTHPLTQVFQHYALSIPQCTQILQDMQRYLQANTSPLLIADTLATQLYHCLHSSSS